MELSNSPVKLKATVSGDKYIITYIDRHDEVICKVTVSTRAINNTTFDPTKLVSAKNMPYITQNTVCHISPTESAKDLLPLIFKHCSLWKDLMFTALRKNLKIPRF